METKKCISIEKTAEAICKHIPKGWIISFNMEQGAAWVELLDHLNNPQELPDTADKSLTEQLNDAICVAKGWDISIEE